MKFSEVTLAVAGVLGASLSSSAFAIDLYVDSTTQQIYAQPGPNRIKLGTFEKVEETASQKAELEAIRNDLALKTNELKALDEHMKEAEQVKVKLDKKGVQFETADKNFQFKLGGRIHADASYSSGDDYLDSKGNHVEANDGTEIRRARMEFTGVFFKDWEFKSQVDFADNSVGVKDMFLQYHGLKALEIPLAITVGQQKQAFSRELQESSNDLMFMERSLMDVLNAPTVDRAIGLNVASLNKDWTGQVGIYGDTVTPNKEKNMADEGWGISSRWTYAPINEKTKVIHLGVAGNYRVPDHKDDVNDKDLRFSYETSHMSNLNLIDTGHIEDVNNIKMVGLEANALYGPFTVGGEYTHMWLDRKDGSDNLEFDGWYGEASWTLTGESRKYKKGKFYHVDPKKPFSLANGGLGAWELAARYAEVDLTDYSKGGQMSNITVALNWYVNNNIRFMADYNRALEVENSPLTTVGGGQPDNLDTFMLRGQLYF
ncbi:MULTISPECIES: OprO/OprP family phosphate-selective porin [Methylobacter]|uniref:OprO/OprP family phosphate-selective porin n=1 Tax=Methylobacter TaxID=429 RepID=UPI0003644566|nr:MULTISPECIES: porin [Methylobacter]